MAMIGAPCLAGQIRQAGKGSDVRRAQALGRENVGGFPVRDAPSQIQALAGHGVHGQTRPGRRTSGRPETMAKGGGIQLRRDHGRGFAGQDQKHGLAGKTMDADRVFQVGQGRSQHLFLGMPDLVSDDDDRVLGQPGRAQFADQFGRLVRREIDGHGRSVSGQLAQTLALGHGRASGQTGDDQGLGGLGYGEGYLGPGGRGKGGGDAGHDGMGDAVAVQQGHLLAHGPEQRRVPGVHSGHQTAGADRVAHQGVGFVQIHAGRINDPGLGSGAGHHLARHQGARIEDQIGLLNQLPAAHGNQARITRTRADEINLGGSMHGGVVFSFPKRHA